ncbi:GNAT family N-acetyltransferase [Providencia vermicola]|uniref:GNAT family N-acetyltransferase n=1 Tax=Providencia TaxID=586 RepID=UPI0012B60B52|nr:MULTISPECIES: GNAT family N-acetyltransferase [unclassified Providencia]ELR5119607.1 GNAT family N-acetyltransferase [Providencia stuartii]MTB39001.1 GNAT family N-acetyltransferase [Providencia sp. wls1949]MTC08339.1 GNAT family N-acetyltransferase [Providencia sp. wls1948]
MLTVTRLTSRNVLEIANVNQLYDSAFPAHEKRSYQGRQSILSHEDYYLYYFSDNGIFIGFIGSWRVDDFFYVEHLAVSSALRGQGYGQKVIQLFAKQVNNIILEIDPVIDEISQKRLRFYLHCGFKQNEYAHIHPSYHPEFKPHQLEILSYPIKINPQIYQRFNQKLINVVMQPSLL